jgi:hypothetical protein
MSNASKASLNILSILSAPVTSDFAINLSVFLSYLAHASSKGIVPICSPG